MDADRNDHLELAVLAASGNRVARQALVQRVGPRVRVIAVAILGNRADAEDAIQATWVEILTSISTYRGESLTAWADRIAARTAMRHARQRRLRATRAAPESDLEILQTGTPTPSFSEHDIPRPLLDYLAALAEPRRVVLVLRHVLGYSIAEISEVTEVPINTVKDRLLHARAQLRRAIRRDLAMVRVYGGREA
ncbi:MAG TPA: sigma-70 family RNA polymerase sigma factor [Polyangiaceae bacterium]|jgi:RNA polymerase sigma-70 factor (ECF subfamily)